MKTQIIEVITNKQQFFVVENESVVRLTEKKLEKYIPNFSDMTLEAREKHFKKWLKNDAYCICCVECGPQLPNARRKVRIDGHRRVCTEDDLRQAAQAFLAVSELFDPQGTGYRLIADILCGQHAMALRTAEPSFHAMSAISSSNLEVESLLCSIVRAVTTIREWEGKNWSVKRDAVLDSRTEQYLPLHIQDHTRLKVKCKETKLTLPMPYTDTSALVIGASSPQIHELTPYIEDASVIFLNCARTELTPTRLNISGYDPQIAAQLRGETSRIAALLRWWWSGALEDEDIWARQVVQKARLSFGKPDSRYIQATLDPKLLRDAIRYQVLLSFLVELEKAKLMFNEELEICRQGAKDVFDPEPEQDVKLRHVEESDVFLELMRNLVKERDSAIVPEDRRFVKADKPMAAWRVIGGERFLVFPEDTWAVEYKRTARKEKGLDCSFFQRDRWTQDLQKILAREGVIKAPSSGYRYRYDLMANGTRDSTYVVVIPAQLLENPANI